LNLDIEAAGTTRITELHELDEFRYLAFKRKRLYKERIKRLHDQNIVEQHFNHGNMVLLNNSRLRLFPGAMNPSRKRRNTGSSASGPGSSSRARGQANDRYNAKAAKKLLHEVHIDRQALEVECPNIFTELRSCQLDIFFELPKEANVQMVREFYANCPEHENGVVTMRNT
uniref:Uncharacterized protein LOC104220674 n=1 Tax=Nicotiana sylvestris TaxID=4096 RepID=A0A1U7W5H2_NICSY